MAHSSLSTFFLHRLSSRQPGTRPCLFAILLDTRSGTLRYASAGHEPPLLARANGTEEALEATGPLLGVGLDLPYGESTVTLWLGDALLMMTDGVTEARSRQGQFLESVGVWRLLRLVLSAATAQEAVTTLDQPCRHSSARTAVMTSPCFCCPMCRCPPMMRRHGTDVPCRSGGRIRSGKPHRPLRPEPLYHQGTVPSSSKYPPVGPSAGSVARRTAAVAPCSTVRVPRC
jgi:hypothetical protein